MPPVSRALGQVDEEWRVLKNSYGYLAKHAPAFFGRANESRSSLYGTELYLLATGSLYHRFLNVNVVCIYMTKNFVS